MKTNETTNPAKTESVFNIDLSTLNEHDLVTCDNRKAYVIICDDVKTLSDSKNVKNAILYMRDFNAKTFRQAQQEVFTKYNTIVLSTSELMNFCLRY